METIEIQLDKQTLERARRLADSLHCTLEELIKKIIEQQEVIVAGKVPFLGMFSSEPELVDQVMELAMKAREEHPMRQNSGYGVT